MKKKFTFLGIETSCDETAAAVIRENDKGTADVLSNVITTKSYVGIGEQSENVKIDISSEVMSNLRISNRILLVDDVVDSGKTIEYIFQYFDQNQIQGEIKVAAVYYKPNVSTIIPDYYIHQTDKWIVFPHELEGLSNNEICNKGIVGLE